MLNPGPRYVEQNLILQGERDKNYMTHLKMKATVKPAFNAQELADTVAFKQEYTKALRQQNKTFNQNEKNIGLNRENAILLNKLVDISQGKWSSVHGPSAMKKKTSKSMGPRSLNISIRRRENERIERENHAFAKRLFQNPGSISKQKLDFEFNKNLELKNRISRVKKPLPNLNGRATQLPPLENSTFKSSKRSFSYQRKNEVGEPGAIGSQTETSKMFASKGEYDLNQSSAGMIPINSMYEGEEERKAAIPPQLERTEEEKIDEAPEEHITERKEEHEQDPPATKQTEVTKKASATAISKTQKSTTSIAASSTHKKSTAKIGKAEQGNTASKESLAKADLKPTESKGPLPTNESIPAANRPATNESIPDANKPAADYEPNADATNFEGEVNGSAGNAEGAEETKE